MKTGILLTLLVALIATPSVTAQSSGLDRCLNFLGTPSFSRCLQNLNNGGRTRTTATPTIFRCSGLTNDAFFDCLFNRATTPGRRPVTPRTRTTAPTATLFPCQGVSGSALLDCLFPDVATRPQTVTTPTTATTNAPSTTIPTLSVIQNLRIDLAAKLDADALLIPAWVQLGFHSCVGGCDGCLDVTIADNRRMAPRYNDLKDLHREKYSQDISLADMLAQAAVQAAEEGMKDDSPNLVIPMRYGREDCPNLNGLGKGEGRFPDSKDPGAITALANEFDLTEKEAIALLGAHSLGRCHEEVLGFEGPWDFSELKLESGYYLSMSRTNWQRTETIKGEFQWNSTDNSRMMLTSDLALWKNIPVRGENKRPQCNPSSECANASQRSRAAVTEYSNNVSNFHRDFTIAFVKMLEKTDSSLFTVRN